MPSPPLETASPYQHASLPLPTPRQFFSTSPPKPNRSASLTLPRDLRHVCPCFPEARRSNQLLERHNQNSAQRFFPPGALNFWAEKLSTTRKRTANVFLTNQHNNKPPPAFSW